MADALRGRRILIVEDEYLIATDLAMRLEEMGAVVIGPAATAETALALIAGVSSPIDGAVLDINLGQGLAYPIADALRDAGVPFIFASGYDDIAVPAAYGQVPRCQKPVDYEALARTLGRQIDLVFKTAQRSEALARAAP
jgi:DNA-binding LytR/AlgR family response regulator